MRKRTYILCIQAQYFRPQQPARKMPQDSARLPPKIADRFTRPFVRFLMKRIARHRSPDAPWDDEAILREEIFSIERLEEHARSLAAAQQITRRRGGHRRLGARLAANESVLLTTYRALAAAVGEGRAITPAAEWLLDNFHLVEEQIREIRADLPPGFYRQLPKLAAGPFSGYPRVFGVAWAFVAHTDSRFDPHMLRRFVHAYQRVQPLTIGELWAIAITLRIVLVENLRRAAARIVKDRGARQDADTLADRLLGMNGYPAEPDALVNYDALAGRRARHTEYAPAFSVQLVKRLRDRDPQITPALQLLEDRLAARDTSSDRIVHDEHRRQGASNVTVRNIITSMRLLSDVDWTEFFESVSTVDAQLRAGSDFAIMDFATRNLYRHAIEQLARGSKQTELAVAQAALAACTTGRARDPGYHLIAAGRRPFEKSIGYRVPLWSWRGRRNLAYGAREYIAAIAAVAVIVLSAPLLALHAWGAGAYLLAPLALLGLIPALDAAIALVNRAVMGEFGATRLPGLALREGVPPEFRTVIAVPMLLTTSAAIEEQVQRLEIHALASLEGASRDGELYFALLSDWADAATEHAATDESLLQLAIDSIARLNRLYPPALAGPRFLLLHRRRIWSDGQKQWMGWERKRGKLHELNRLLRGAADTTFLDIDGHAPTVPGDVRYVITLDADTRLPRETARRLIGKMAHPLNRPSFDAATGHIVEGYAVLQPRVAPSLPIGREGSLFQRAFSSASGIDPYAAAVSDVYQDLFGEGSYAGKGIYEIDAFEAALAGRVPDGTLLSHDLFEGLFARAGLASDVEVVEEFPARYDVAAARHHRWARGDWQLLPWILGRGDAGQRGNGTKNGHLSLIGRWKMLDNLRRTLSAPAAVAALLAGWLLLPVPGASLWTAFALATMALPAVLPVLAAILPRSAGITARSHLRALRKDALFAASQTALLVTFVAYQGWLMADAIGRTLFRLLVTRSNLLQWVTAAQAQLSDRLDLAGAYRRMSGGVAIAVAAAILIGLRPDIGWLAAPFIILWIASPAIAVWISRSPRVAGRLAVSEADAHALRLIARRTWRYFETFVTADDNMLPPDNFQEDPQPVLAHRTSPTNLGLYLLSTVSAHDFGWTGTLDTVERLEATLATMARLERFRGHFYNWYDTRDLRALDPRYVSSVDSGNLAAHLIALANACPELTVALPDTTRSAGIADCRALAGDVEDSSDAAYWTHAIQATTESHRRDDLLTNDEARSLQRRIATIASTARTLAESMQFGFLLDPERRLLSIGYPVNEGTNESTNGGTLDPSCYDLLASEARLASFFAIAKHDIPARHWFRLGRPVTPLGAGAALLSWSGSMFEYLMPALIMRAPAGSLLEQTSRLVVRRQADYGAALGIPWGISESAYNARDLELTYQYSNFGVPGLGLKRGLSENVVIAPYATALAAMVDPQRAMRNFVRLAAAGARGRYGFYEALDYTRSRLPEGTKVAIVRAFMAHHQGMTVVAIANALLNGRMRARFHAEPAIQATELLLQERTPRNVSAVHPRAEEVATAGRFAESQLPDVRRPLAAHTATPQTHLLSNGRYAVMLTNAGSGYSRWNNLSLTRWRADSTCDDTGSYIYLRDVHGDAAWSTGYQPCGVDADRYEVTFNEDRAQFVRHDGAIVTVQEVLVSPEDDTEVRRVSITNSGAGVRDIEVTCYSELALAPSAADAAHPAFSKLFVQTEYLPEQAALLATRRRRTPTEPPVWTAQHAVVEGEILGEPQIETDRARFLGRGGEVRRPLGVIGGQILSGTTGTVLDPVFALRYRLRIAAGRTARIAFWTAVAATREGVLDLLDKHRDASAFVRASTMAWTQAQVQLRHLDIDAAQARLFQRLAGPVLFADASLRPSSDTIRRGGGSPAALWAQGISGDIPIVLLRIDDVADIAVARELLRAHEYWRMKRLAVDLVILNEHAASYQQDLQVALDTELRMSHSRPPISHATIAEDKRGAQGAAFVLRADRIDESTRARLSSVARVVLNARHGTLSDQLDRLLAGQLEGARPPATAAPGLPVNKSPPPAQTDSAQPHELEFFNGLGGFAADGREYVTLLRPGQVTPAPWINVVANPDFGFQVSAEGGGFTWSLNSRQNQLTPWSNDPVTDRPGEVLYLRDEDSGELWGATAAPAFDTGDRNARYISRHGQGYSRFERHAHGIALELLMYVPLADPIKISRLTIRNLSSRPRKLSITAYVEWVLGDSQAAAAPFVVTEIDPGTGALFASNPWNGSFGARVAFADLAGRQTQWSADRREFIGRCGTLNRPAALVGSELDGFRQTEPAPLSGRVGAGLDPCAALQTTITLAPDESTEIVFFLGQADSAAAAQTLLLRYRSADLDAILHAVHAYWDDTLGTVQVKTPDRSLDIILNRWMLYQTLVCRLWARSAFYQASGAFGFRDQLQDTMALAVTRPALAREHLLRAACRQFIEGDVQHWWLPSTAHDTDGTGVRTRISDDRVWLAYATTHYIQVSGDWAVLEAQLPFLEGQALRPDEQEAYFKPTTSDLSATLFEHCARALDQSLQIGTHGLPLIGAGDWNDGMNRVGEQGRGESVWLGWFLHTTLVAFAAVARARGGTARATQWLAHADSLRESLEREAWDGDWYRRGYFDDGTPLGSVASTECRIDSIAQSWGVISGAANPDRARRAMAAVDYHLVQHETGLALLFTPPFEHAAQDPGYVKAYPPGIRENGGHYTHAATWSVMAYAALGQGERAAQLLSQLNPINRTLTPADVLRYKVEPYVAAADIYSVAPHVGRGGWTWYTGSAGWIYRAGIESILGFRVQGASLTLAPCIPAAWPHFEIMFRYAGARYDIRVDNPQRVNSGIARIELDGAVLPDGDNRIVLMRDGKDHTVRVTLGTATIENPVNS